MINLKMADYKQTDDAYVNAVLHQLTGQQTQYRHSSSLLDGRPNPNFAGNSNVNHGSDNSVNSLGNPGINSSVLAGSANLFKTFKYRR